MPKKISGKKLLLVVLQRKLGELKFLRARRAKSLLLPKEVQALIAFTGAIFVFVEAVFTGIKEACFGLMLE